MDKQSSWKTFSLLLASIWLTACGGDPAPPPEIVQRDGQPDVIRASDEEMMAKAVAEAKRTLPEFDQALSEKQAGTTDFALKKGYIVDEEGSEEHIWCINIVATENGYRGKINNEPVDAPNLKLGQSVEIKPEEVSDWMYFEDGKLRGGFTIVALTYGTDKQERLQKIMNIDWSRYDFLPEEK